VLKLHVVRGPGVDYYARDLVPGRAEETLVAGESPGHWTGRGSAGLGLDGPVESTVFIEVLAGRDPGSGSALRSSRRDRPVSGFDLTFCAPKSVSVLHLLAPAELGAAAGTAHQSAVADAVGYLERQGHGVRRTRSSEVHPLGTTGVVAAGFVHRTSRALDPHLHTHLVTANVAQGVDGIWSSLDSRRLFHHRRAIEAVYGASLRHHLTGAAGVAWRQSPQGRWEVDGVDPVLCRLFSQRSASIDERAHRAGGRTSPGRRRVAFFHDRPDKDMGGTVDGLRAAWRRRTADIGLDSTDLIRVVGRAQLAPHGPGVDPMRLDAGLGHLVATRTQVSSRDLVAVVADAAPWGLAAGATERAASALVATQPHDAIEGGERHVDTWEPGEVAGVFRTDPDVVARAIDGRASVSADLERSDNLSAGRGLRRADAFGHQGLNRPGLMR
jgi:conjugative relaxase-like TrwC/TraI family protein